jgi:polyisoprenoid-binding protein YceI
MRRNLISLVGLFAVLTFALPQAVRAADTFKIDPVHSFVVFNIDHVGVNRAWGRTGGPSGTVSIDDADPSKSKLEVEVAAESIDTGNAGRDKHLKGPDFFDVKQFPKISFKSTQVRKSGDNMYEVTGEFNLHGQSKPITVTLTKIGEGDKGPQMGHRVGYGTEFTLKRSDFGMTTMQGMLGDEVKIYVNLEATNK